MNSLPRIPEQGREWVSGNIWRVTASHTFPWALLAYKELLAHYHGEDMEEGGGQLFLNLTEGERVRRCGICSRLRQGSVISLITLFLPFQGAKVFYLHSPCPV